MRVSIPLLDQEIDLELTRNARRKIKHSEGEGPTTDDDGTGKKLPVVPMKMACGTAMFV